MRSTRMDADRMPSPAPVVIGWDIGGAHVKAALLRHGKLESVRQWPCALWQGLQRLDPVIDDACAAWKAALDSRQEDDAEHAVTMTGEMVDAFESREHGVIQLVLHLRRRLGPRLRLFCDNGDWIGSAAVADRWQDLASANWAATARFAATRAVAERGNALLVDIGTTTTDFIRLAEGRVVTAGHGDRQRLQSGELLYQGVVRTPLCALEQRIDFLGRQYNVMNEWFATTADVYRLTAELHPAHDQHPAADNGAKDVAGSCRRIARMIGHDARDAREEDWIAFAGEWRRLQLARIEAEMLRVAAPQGASDAGGAETRADAGGAEASADAQAAAPVLIGAGCGSFLVRALAECAGRGYVGFDELVDAPAALRSWTQVCAPAVSVAFLRHEACRAAP